MCFRFCYQFTKVLSQVQKLWLPSRICLFQIFCRAFLRNWISSIKKFSLKIIIFFLKSSQPEIRFNSFKIFSDIIFQLLNDDNFYDSPSANVKTFKEMIIKYFLQNLKVILNDQEPMPLYGVKLLGVLTKKDINFVSILKSLKFLNLIMDFFNVNNPKLSLVTLKLIGRIVECKDISLEDLASFNFFPNVNNNLLNII